MTAKLSPAPATKPSPELSAALKYAKRGWHVFPLWDREGDGCGCGNGKCNSPGKHPISDFAPNGFKSATTDPDQITDWWRQYPRAGIGVATGKVSGIIVLDVDVKKGKDGLSSLEKLENELGTRLPETKTAKTPSGGLHYYYVYVAGIGSSTDKLGPGLDIRGDGGYVVMPPSHDLYEWDDTGGVEVLPDRWVDRLQRLFAKSERLSNGGKLADPILVAAALAVIPNPLELSRDDWLNIGMATHAATGGSEDGFRLWDHWSERWPNYNEEDTRTAWNSFKPHSIGPGTLFSYADQACPGWRSSSKRTSLRGTSPTGACSTTDVATSRFFRSTRSGPIGLRTGSRKPPIGQARRSITWPCH
jgi:hypothetical protein